MTTQDTASRWEIFHNERNMPIGLLHRRWNSDELVTTVVFGNPEPHHVVDRIELAGRRWIRSHHTEDGAEPVVVEAAGLIEEEDTIPTTMEFLLLMDTIANVSTDDEHTVSYHVFAPNDRHALAEDASIWSPEEGIWEIEVNGELASTHRVHDGEIIASDWQGVRSSPVPAEVAATVLNNVIDQGILQQILRSEP